MITEYSNIIYQTNILKIGGCETVLYEIAKKYKDYDITVLYNNADANQLKRLRKYIRVQKIDKNKKYKCKKLFMMYNVDMDLFEAEEYIQMIHANYKVQNLKINTDKRVNRYVAVSKWVAKDYEDLLKEKGIDKKVEVCYNPLEVEKPKKLLKLISATRLSQEKGKDRMQILANELDKNGIPYQWLIFTTDTKEFKNRNVIYKEPRLDIRDYIADADYLVQLSDTEGFCMSVFESLLLGTAVITTPIPSFLEMGVEDGKNGYILDFKMKDIPIDKIYNKIPKFTYKKQNDIYDKLFYKSKSTYNPNEKVEVIVKREYFDMELNRKVKKGECLIIHLDRANELKELKLVE